MTYAPGVLKRLEAAGTEGGPYFPQKAENRDFEIQKMGKTGNRSEIMGDQRKT